MKSRATADPLALYGVAPSLIEELRRLIGKYGIVNVSNALGLINLAWSGGRGLSEAIEVVVRGCDARSPESDLTCRRWHGHEGAHEATVNATVTAVWDDIGDSAPAREATS